MKKKTTLLCVLDGLGINPNPEANAVTAARTPTLDRLWKEWPNTELRTDGIRVGLPEGNMGNSEVGHLNIGAGRVVKQWLYLIGSEIASGFLDRSDKMKALLAAAKNGRIHLVGLYSSGGVHSHYDHLFALLDFLSSHEVQVVLHLITDGRDTAPNAAGEELVRLEQYLGSHNNVSVGSVTGRYYAMDRDKRWDRTEKAYRAIALADAAKSSSASEAIESSYESGTTDEFILPHVISPSPIKPEDGVIFWNFRADRMRQITAALCSPEFSHFKREAPLPAASLSFTEYDHSFNVPFLFEHEEIRHNLGEVIAENGLSQLRIAETEKYPHVTYFFNGGNEAPFPNEDRIMIPSPRDVATYDLKPEMSARQVTDKVVESVLSGKYDLIVLNFANSDMVGHTGVMSAAVRAVETVDGCLARCLEAIDQNGGQALIFADHGNAEQMIDYTTGQPHTAHTTFPVPIFLYGAGWKEAKLRGGGALCDVAPTILAMMKLKQPAEMTGKSLIS